MPPARLNAPPGKIQAATAARRRRRTAPAKPMPTIIIAQVAGSGTAPVEAFVALTITPLGPVSSSVKRKLTSYTAPTVVAMVWE